MERKNNKSLCISKMKEKKPQSWARNKLKKKLASFFFLFFYLHLAIFPGVIFFFFFLTSQSWENRFARFFASLDNKYDQRRDNSGNAIGTGRRQTFEDVESFETSYFYYINSSFNTRRKTTSLCAGKKESSRFLPFAQIRKKFFLNLG